ncbi:MAG: MBL fold metallo-hydrolase [Acidobacteria bacterium]|nr:MBL fold metallo-hydrolase [Acidobacteriota bacterium]
MFPTSVARAYALAQQAPPADPVAAAAATRKQMAATPIEVTKLTDALTMLSGPGGNVVVLTGRDGKVVVDTFIQGAFAPLKQRLDAMGNAPILYVIDTHWHFDHADNNESFRKADAAIIAHENTRKRLSEPHDLLGMHFNPSPAGALPTQTFAQSHTLKLNGEQVDLAHVPPAHTDTDITVHFTRGNVLHMGDLFFNGMYPFIDASTRGNINGMIAAADRALKLVNAATRIVPGHGPLADRGALTRYRDVLVTVRDRVATLKKAGRTEKEVVAAKPTADLDPAWGKGFMMPDVFVGIVYNTL